MERIIESQIRQPVSYKKTVTLPEEVMKALGVGPRDNVVFQIRGGEVKLISSFTMPIGKPPISTHQLQKSDSLKLGKGVKFEYEVQRVIKKEMPGGYRGASVYSRSVFGRTVESSTSN